MRGSITGLPMDGASVALSVEGSLFTSELTSPESGRIDWVDLPGDKVTLTITKQGYRPQQERVTLERGQNTLVIVIEREATPTPAVTLQLVPITEVEAALRDAGFRRFPFTNSDGVSGFSWVRENPYERMTTWEDGRMALEVLHDSSAAIRNQHMEIKLGVMDRVFPDDFMELLRAEHAQYNRTVSDTVSGEPDWVRASGGEWKSVWAEYYGSERRVGAYDVKFFLLWWQSTCPPQALFCYYESFPGLEFTGDSSFIWYTIMLRPSRGPGIPSQDA